MSLLKHLFSFYVFSNIHVSLATFCLTKISLLEYGIDNNTIPLFVFTSTLVSYNFIRFYQIKEINRSVSIWILSKKKSLILLNIFAMILLIFLTFKIRVDDFLVLIPFALATVFYVKPFSRKKKNLRSVASLKLFLIAFSWAGITVLLPLVHHHITFSNDFFILLIQRFLIVMAITIPFDLRDVNFDKAELKTLPQVIGVEKSKYIGSTALFAFFVLQFFRTSKSESTTIVTLIITVVSLLFLNMAGTNQNRFYSSFWVESIPIFWFLILLL